MTPIKCATFALLIFALSFPLTSRSGAKNGKALKGPLAINDCKWLHAEVLPACAKNSPDCDDVTDLVTEAPMSIMRPYNGLLKDSRFKATAFKAACEKACEAKKIPEFESFQSAVCK